MDFLRRLAVLVLRWIDDATWAIMSIISLIRPRKKYEVVEQEDLAFLVQALGRRSARRAFRSRLRFVDRRLRHEDSWRAGPFATRGGTDREIVLARRRFVFRSLELPPAGIADFLDAIVRSQIDRLTPWSPIEAAFGCGAPTETSSGRIGVVVVATARSSVMPFVTALGALKPNSIVVSAASAADEAQRRTIVFSQQSNRELSMQRLASDSWSRPRRWQVSWPSPHSRLGYLSAQPILKSVTASKVS